MGSERRRFRGDERQELTRTTDVTRHTVSTRGSCVDMDETASFLNLAVNRFALPNDAAFVRERCIPACFVCQVLQPHVVPSAICAQVEP
jgi:hypothetical protein